MSSVADLVEPVKVQVRAKPADFKAGKVIAEAHGVTLEEFNPIKVSATVGVAGFTETRHTLLTSHPDGLQWSCTCTTDPKLFCKHLVATALIAWQEAPKRKGK